MKKVLDVFLTISALAAGAVYAYRQGWASRTVTWPQPTHGASGTATSGHQPSAAPEAASGAGASAAIDAAIAALPAETSAVSGPLTNIAASTFGGHIARMTGEFGPGYFGRSVLLKDGRFVLERTQR